MVKEFKGKKVIGLTEEVTLLGNKKEDKSLLARIDTGATKSSIDVDLAADLNLGPIIRSKLVKSASGNKLRPVIEVSVVLAGKKLNGEFSLADRSHMKYRVLIGQNLLKKGFLVDPAQE